MARRAGRAAGILIVGAGQAGLQLATSLRDLGYTGAVTLVGADRLAPYQRPPLSKAFLQDQASQSDLLLRDPAFYREKGIRLLSGVRVADLRLTDAATGAGEAVTQDGDVLTFDRLALTTGGRPRLLPVEGRELAGIHLLRTVDQAQALRAELASAQEIVVVGGGFIGLEVAAAARAAGKRATVVEAADRLLPRGAGPALSRFLAEAHRRRGTRVILGTQATAFEGTGHVTGVCLDDGTVLAADLVVVGIGLTPNVRLARRIGLACPDGVEVDRFARTSVSAVVAAGDCTCIRQDDGTLIRLESVQNAISQAKVAAATLLGVPQARPETPWFWSDQADLKIQIAGLSAGHDAYVVRGVPETESFSIFYYRRSRLTAIEAVNAPRDYMAVRRLLDLGRSIPPEAAADPDVALKDFLRDPRYTSA